MKIKRLFFLLSLFSCHRSSTLQQENDPRESIKTSVDVSVIYRSTDVGKSWHSFAAGLPAEATISNITQKGTKIFVSTDYHGVFVSGSGLNQWGAISTGLPEGVDINALAIHNQQLLAGTFRHGVYISSDDGKQWQPSRTVLNTPIRDLLSFHNKLLSATDQGLYVSTDDGETWQHLYGTKQVNGFTVLNNKIYAAVMNGAIMSTDQGVTWNYIYQPHALHDISTDGESIYAMTLGAGLLKTNNDGLTWQSANSGLGNRYTFEVKSINNNHFAAQWLGVYHSTNGTEWSIIKNGLPDSTAFTTLEVTDSGILAAVGLRK